MIKLTITIKEHKTGDLITFEHESDKATEFQTVWARMLIDVASDLSEKFCRAAGKDGYIPRLDGLDGKVSHLESRLANLEAIGVAVVVHEPTLKFAAGELKK